MTQDDSKKPKRDKFVVVGGAWLHRKGGGTGTQYFKLTVMIENRQVSLSGWPNQKKTRKDQPDYLLYAIQKPAE